MGKHFKTKNPKERPQKDCSNCANALYIGEGDTMCNVSDEIVFCDWQATENFKANCSDHEVQ